MPWFTDGFKYTADDYYAMRPLGEDAPWHRTAGQDTARTLREQGVPALIDSGAVDEVWFFGDHFMLFGEGSGRVFAQH